MLATDGPKGHLRKISRLTKSFEKKRSQKTSNIFPRLRRRTARCAQIPGSLLESAGNTFSVAAVF